MTDPAITALVAELQARLVAIEPLAGDVLLDLGETRVHIRDHSVEVVPDAAGADCRVRLAYTVLRQILDGERDAFEAFLSGEIATEGDMSVAVQLQPLLGPEDRRR